MISLAAGILACVLAQPAPQGRGEEGRLAAAVARLSRAESGAERARARAEVIGARQEVLSRVPADDPSRPGLLVDQAWSHLDDLGESGSDLVVLLGIPLEEDARRTRETAGRALELAAEAMALIPRRLAEIDALPADAPGSDDLLDRWDALEFDQSVRAPAAGGRAAALLAAIAEDPARRASLVEEATRLLASTRADDSRVADAVRASLAAALVIRGGREDRQAARRLYERLLNPGAERGPSATTAAEAKLGLVLTAESRDVLSGDARRVRAARESPPFTTSRGPDAFWVFLSADAIARAMADVARRDRDAGLASAACEEVWEVAARRDLGIDPARARAIAHRKSAWVASATAGVLAPPPRGALGLAVTRAADPASRQSAIAQLRALASRGEEDPVSTEASWELGALLSQARADAERLEAARWLSRFARSAKGDERAPAAALAAVACACPVAEAAESEIQATALAIYIGSIDAAIGVVTPVPVELLIERARVLLSREGPGDFEAALGTLEAVPRGSVEAPAAAAMHLSAASRRLDRARGELRGARRERDDERVRRIASGTIVPLAQRAWTFARDRESDLEPALRADLADALTEAGLGGGAQHYEHLLRAGADVPGGEARLRLGRARQRLIRGEREQGFDDLRELLAELPEPRAGEDAELFWHAWTIALEVLRGEDRDGTRTATARAHAARLRLIDPALGGEPWRSRIDAATEVRR